MKKYLLTYSILLVFVLSACPPILWGNNPLDVSMKKKEMQLVEAISLISKEYNVYFTFDHSLVKDIMVEYETKENRSVEEAISGVLSGTDLKFKLYDKRFVILYQNDEKGLESLKEMVKHFEHIIADGPETKAARRSLKAVTAIPIRDAWIPKARELRHLAMNVAGRVTDQAGEPLIGVNVQVKGTSKGTSTDINGEYTLNDVNENAILVFSYIGYQRQEIPVDGRMSVDVTMLSDAQMLDEVVVVGYGTQRKSDLTGAVSQVKAEDLTAYPSSQVAQALQGRAAGVQVQSNNGGEPGSGFQVRVRGATSINASSNPLYVVDGFPGASIPPSEDIASIEILKDASATAIYGSRGANGVILITTKRGISGETRVELSSSISSQQVSNKIDLLQSSDYLDYLNEARPGTFDPNTSYPDVNWQDEIFRNSLQQNHQLSLSGGNEKIRYYVSGIMFDQEGIILNSGSKRYTITSNLDIQVRKNLKFGANLYGGQFARNGVVTQEGSGGGTGTGVVSAAVLMEPVVPVFNEDGSYAISPVGDPHDSPVAIALERTNENRSQTLQGNFYAELDILEGLTWKSTLGARTGNNRNGYYVPTTLNAGVQVNGEGGINAGQDVNLVTEHYLTFEKHINEIHNLSLLGGYSYQKFRNESWNTSTRDFISDAFEYWNLSAGSATLNPSSSLTESELASYYGRINYRLFDRYLLTFNARYDGSSNFARNHKWAFFPSGAIAWNLAEENFIQAIRGISELKIRGSYGITGNQAISPYQSLARLRSLPSTSINNTIVNAVAPHPNSVANDNLKWESTAQINIGLDLGLFNQRVGFTADYYRMKTSDLLFSFPLPQYSGYNSVIKNIGTTENKGFEMVLSTVNLEGQVRWTTDFNFSLNRNKILELPEGNDIPIGSAPGHMVGIGSTQILREGEPTGQFYGYVYEGVYQQGEEFLEGAGFEKNVGGEKFRDLNMDGKLDADDRTLIGNPNPDFMWGINNTLEYKGFDLNFFIHGVQGNDIYSFLMFELGLLSGLNNATTDALNRWTPSNTNTDVPVANGNRARISSSRYVFDGSFIRFKNISLGYRFPQSILSRLGISYLRPYLSAQNLITLTDYPGFDPEVNYRGSNTNQGLDYGGYPYVSSYTFGIQIKF